MGNLIEKIRQFMYNRYGLDELGRLNIGVWVVMLFLKVIMPCTLVDLLASLAVIVFALRFFSRDIYRRQQENNKYLAIKSKFFSWYDHGDKNSAKRRAYIFRNCPHCGAKLRLPNKRGKHVCACPRCSRDFDVRVW